MVGVLSKDRIMIPCGICSSCLGNRRQDWVIRLIEESKQYDSSLFVTLTYDDQHLPSDGVNKKHLQDFFKRLRKKIKFRYYAVGEYGSRTHRAHYHVIFFGLSLQDFELIQKSWYFGNVSVFLANDRTIGYISKYHVNRGNFPLSLNPSFTLMSRKPGIGANYIQRMKDYHEGNINRSFYQEFEVKKRLPRFYKDKLYSDEERKSMRMCSDLYDVNEFLEFSKKYPGKSYFVYKQQQIEEANRKFKQKSKLNQKL